MKKILSILLFSFLYCLSATARDFILKSPNSEIRATISLDEFITYSLSFKNKQYLTPSRLSLNLANGEKLGYKPMLTNEKRSTINRLIIPLYGISNRINDNYNELRINFKGAYSVVFRAYNEGFAYRFETNISKELIISDELSEFQFAENLSAYFHPQLSESFYRLQKVSDFDNKPNYSSLPLLLKTAENVNILIHESDVFNYPCMSVRSDSLHLNRLTGNHALYPKVAVPGGYNNFNLIVKENERFIARTDGKRTFPWRIIAFEEHDKDILNNQIVYLLASENRIKDVSWIKPGKVSWDWWNSLNLSGVPFKTGFNTQTYKYYIDFAAAHGIEYVNLDEGWSDQFNLLKVTDKLNMEDLLSYAKEKNVGLILWCVWHTLDKQMIQALNLFEKWGVAGLKVDFMDRDDQVVVEFQERLLIEAAKRKMLVNYHGAYHPTGVIRTFPNNINVEGVRGLEYNKFDSLGTTPDHAVTIPFIRMFAGPMDYTPGAMNNFNKKDWKQINDRPSSQGTRCQQLAMYIVYFAPLQMLSDSPTAYQKDPVFLKFLSGIPVTWDETLPLESKLGEVVSVARRKDTVWYLGSICGWQAHKVQMSLDFLDSDKSYEIEIFSDGQNADRVGNDYQVTKKIVKKGEIINADLAPGGGYAARLTLVNTIKN